MAAKNDKSNRPPNVTAGTGIRMKPPATYDRQPKPAIPEIEVVGGFKTFLREHAVIALAIGFVVATQIQSLAKQLIASFIDPSFKLLFGHKLSNRTFTWHFHDRAANFGWGKFVYALLDVLFVLIVIYLIVRIFKLENLENPKKKKPPKKDETVVRYKFEEQD
jgi:large-conductance mechanosensitive channel